MLLVAVAWLYVVLMIAVVEAASPQGTLMGAVLTLLFYGVLPLAILGLPVLQPGATPAARRRKRLCTRAGPRILKDLVKTKKGKYDGRR